MTVCDERDSIDRPVLSDDDADLGRDGEHTWERVHTGGDEPANREDAFVSLVFVQARRRQWCGNVTVVRREMRMHLSRVVIVGIVVVQMDVDHRRRDGTRLNRQSQKARDKVPHHELDS